MYSCGVLFIACAGRAGDYYIRYNDSCPMFSSLERYGIKMANSTRPIQTTNENSTDIHESWSNDKNSCDIPYSKLKKSLKACESTERVFKLIDYVIYWILMHLHEAWKLIRLESVQRFIQSFYFNVQKQVKINNTHWRSISLYLRSEFQFWRVIRVIDWMPARIYQTERNETEQNMKWLKHFINMFN